MSSDIFIFTFPRHHALTIFTLSPIISLLCLLPVVAFIIRHFGFTRNTPPKGCRRLGLPLGQSNLHDEFDHKYSRGAPSDRTDEEGKPSWRIKALFAYPIKSCAAVELDVADVVATGFAFDRQFCFAEYFIPANEDKPYWDARTLRNGHFSKMTLIRPEIWVPDPTARDYAADLDEVKSQGVMIIYYPRVVGTGVYSYLVKFGMALRLIPRERSFRVPLVPLPDREKTCPSVPVKIWKDSPVAYDYGQHIPQALREFLAGSDNSNDQSQSRPLTLFRVDSSHHRQIFRNAPREKELGFQPVTGFADAYPIHILNLASVHDVAARCAGDISRLTARRFRANIIMQGPEAFAEDHWKRISIRSASSGTSVSAPEVEIHTVCRTVRCRLPNVDPDTGIRHRLEPDKTLKSYRRIDPGDTTNACLGMQCVPAVQEFTIRVGDLISLLETGEHCYIKLLKPSEKVEGV